MFCNKCGAEQSEDHQFCQKCGAQLKTTPDTDMPSLPTELHGWNWGAAGFTWIWGVTNSVWISLLTWVPIMNIFWWIVLGIRGTEWAWEAGGYKNPEQFKHRQNNWKIAGIIYFCLIPGIAIIGFLSSIGLVSLNGAREKARDAVKKTDLATLRTAVILYADDHNGVLPTGPDSATATTNWNSNGIGVLADPTYIATLPVPLASTIATTYWYKTSTDATHYLFTTQLESGGAYYYVNDTGDSKEVSTEPSCSSTCP